MGAEVLCSHLNWTTALARAMPMAVPFDLLIAG
jgi:hypothetical protein